MTEKDIILTSEGREELEKELSNLINVIRPQVIEELVEARAQGDLSENADYDAARNRQAEVEARIKEIETMLSKAKIIEDSNNLNKEIKVGTTVTFQNLKTKKEMTVKIVGVIEADPFESKISNESPLAKAMLGKSTNDTCEVRELKEPYKILIKDIK
ncbi:transcription elongation factor GreA [Spiroplasma turonicum]|uniref:Transcription elongation factor GreA n=1 Tax=Spiroplasma turonicum TaxID=216946 RepID=A0A0K1P739_9MOLU|nr:transcription elongation factor GreA [Spiroplasma turonicum]AKU80136.1 transcription elongation factor GreA [Spiroplasma turonicum]ALX71136.1 transcription elongation factor GreA [Spiroplasma turonicum]